MKAPMPFLLSAAVLVSTAAVAQAAPVAPPAFTVKVFAGAPSHSTIGPDDITSLGGHLFVAWQNGIGPKGEAGPHKVLNSLLVEYGARGRAVARWPLAGKIDGIAGAGNRVVATVNEDGNSSLYVIKPSARKKKQVTAYSYQPAPDANGAGALHTGGGTDSVAILGGQILVSASAPTHSGRTATFRVVLTKHKKQAIAKLHPTFSDSAHATDAVTGNGVKLHLTDPDSSAIVPVSSGDTYGGDYVLDSQGDGELIFASGLGSGPTSLTRLSLTYGALGSPATVDDVRWSPSNGASLYAVDNGVGRIYKITGPFSAGDAVASMDTVATKTFGHTIATLNDGSGQLDPFITGLSAVKGLLFMP